MLGREATVAVKLCLVGSDRWKPRKFFREHGEGIRLAGASGHLKCGMVAGCSPVDSGVRALLIWCRGSYDSDVVARLRRLYG